MGRITGRMTGRMTNRRWTLPAVVALAVAVGLGLAAGAGARSPGPGGPGGPGVRGFGGPGLERAIERLELDAAKRAEVFGVIDAARPAARELRGQLRAAHEEMRALLADPSAGEDAVLARADAIGALQTELRKQELRTLLQVRALLPAEQQAQLAESLQKRHCGGRPERGHVL